MNIFVSVVTFFAFLGIANADYLRTEPNFDLGDKTGFLDVHSLDGFVRIQTNSSIGDGINVEGDASIWISGSVANHIWIRAKIDRVRPIKDIHGNETLDYRGWHCKAEFPNNIFTRVDLAIRNRSSEVDGNVRCSKPLLD